MALTIDHNQHNEDTDNFSTKTNQHERTLVTGEESSRGAQSEDWQYIGHVMQTTGDHRGDRCATARPHQCARVTCTCAWNEQTETQDGIQRGLDPKASPDGHNIPAVTQKLLKGVLPALCPGEDGEIETCHEGEAKKECSEGNKIALQSRMSLFLMIVFISFCVLRQIALKSISILAYAKYQRFCNSCCHSLNADVIEYGQIVLY